MGRRDKTRVDNEIELAQGQCIAVVDKLIGGKRIQMRLPDATTVLCRVPNRLHQATSIRIGMFAVLEDSGISQSSDYVLCTFLGKKQQTFLHQQGQWPSAFPPPHIKPVDTTQDDGEAYLNNTNRVRVLSDTSDDSDDSFAS